jgi:two-component system invasion response regulator UvrY
MSADLVRVLVVDDQPPFRAAARAVVDRMEGFEVVAEAASGEEAVVKVAEVHPHLILMDIKMDGIDGIEATRQVLVVDPLVKVVLLSTYELDDLPPAARTSGAIGYVNKDEFGTRVLRRLWSGADGGEFVAVAAD